MVFDNKSDFTFNVFVSLTVYIDLKKQRERFQASPVVRKLTNSFRFCFYQILESEPLRGNIEIFFHFLGMVKEVKKYFIGSLFKPPGLVQNIERTES